MVEAMAAIAAAIALGIGALASAWVQTNVGTAGIGAAAEKEALFGKVLVLTALPETHVILGFVIALLLIVGA
jgi:V/A-type H+-transporting ATPase subunit K